MFTRSPQQLRSGSKGQPVPLSTGDKRNLQRSSSLSSPPVVCSFGLFTNTMPGSASDKTAARTSEIENWVKTYLSSHAFFTTLAEKMEEAMKPIIEAAVKSALSAVNNELTNLREEINSLRGELKRLDDALIDRSDDLEQYQRRNNVRIFGIKESLDESTDRIVVNLCREKLGVDLTADAICRSHRVGKTLGPAADGRERHRAIIVRFTSYQHRRSVYASKKKLKGTGITIREDLTSRRQEVYRRAVAVHGVRNTWTQDGRVLWLDKEGQKGMTTRPADLLE